MLCRAVLVQVISELVEQCGVSDIKEDKLFSTLRSMGDTIAVCDKLLRYPLPLAWSRHTSRWDHHRGCACVAAIHAGH